MDKELARRITALAWLKLSDAVQHFRTRVAADPTFAGVSGREALAIWTAVLKQAVENDERVMRTLDAVNQEAKQEEVA